MQKGFAPILVLVGILVLALVAGGAYYVNKVVNTPPEVLPVITPTPKPIVSMQPTSLPDETANWKTYTNNVSAFSLKYPSDWKVNENENQIKITNSKQLENPNITYSSHITPQSEIIIEINKTPDYIDIKALRNFTQSGDTLEITRSSEIEFQGKTAIEYQAKGIGIEEQVSGINVGLGKNFLRIMLKNYAKDSKNQKILNQILSTFRFTQ